MDKPHTIKMNWHIIVIIVMISALSITSWVQFSKQAKSLIVFFFPDQKETSSITRFVSDLTALNVCAATGNTTSENKAAVHLPAAAAAAPAATEDKDQKTRLSRGQKLKEKTAALCDKIDKSVNKIDSMWSVYNKKELSNIDLRITYWGTGEISSVQVLSGKENWLFYKTKVDGDPIADYEGTNLFTQAELEKMKKTALEVQEKLKKKGIKLTILIAPNKESIYWEYMPETYVHAARSRTDILSEYLHQKGVSIVFPKEEELAEHLSRQVYYYYDTHWNQLGAYTAVKSLMSSWDLSIPALSDRVITSKPLHGNYHYNAQDDLAKLVDLRSVLTDDIEYEIKGTAPMDWTTYEREQSAKSVSHFFNEKAVNEASVLLVGDSFRSSMLPALREQFRDVYVIYRQNYTPDLLDDIQPDHLVAEYAERYSKSIMNLKILIDKD